MPPITIDFADTRSILAALGSTEGGSHLPEIAAVHAAAQKAGDCSLAHMQRAQLLRELAESRAEVAELREQLRLLEHTAKYQDYLLLRRAGEEHTAQHLRRELGLWFNARSGAVARTLSGSACSCETTHEGERGVACGGCGWMLLDRVTLGEFAEPVSSIAIYPLAPPREAAPPVDEEASALARAGVFVTPWAVCPVCHRWAPSGCAGLQCMALSGTCQGVFVPGQVRVPHPAGQVRGPLAIPELARLRIGIWVHTGRGEMALALNSEPCDCQEARSPDGDLYTHARGGAPRCPCGWTFVRVLSDWVHAPASGNGRWRSIPLASLDGAAPAAPPAAIPCGGGLARAADVMEEDERRIPRTLRSAHEGAAAAVRTAATLLCEEYVLYVLHLLDSDRAVSGAIGTMQGAVKRVSALLSDALLLLTETPPRFDFAGALFARLIKSYEGTLIRPGVYRLELSLGNLRSAISIVEGDERAVWTRAAVSRS